MPWTLVVLVFAGTPTLFGGMCLGFVAIGWQKKPPMRVIALAGLALSALSLSCLNGIPAVPSAAVSVFCTGLLILSPANERFWFDTLLDWEKLPLRVIEYMRMFAFGGSILSTAGLAFIDGSGAVLAAVFGFVCAVVLALRPVRK